MRGRLVTLGGCAALLLAAVLTGSQPGARAPGTFPVLLTQNPYGTAQSPVAPGDYYVQRGYIYIAASVRGTDASGGQVSWFGRRQGEDGAELVGWAARTLAGSDGEVGLDGCSYLGVDQWFTAAAVGKNSALKVIAPFCTDSDFYETEITATLNIVAPDGTVTKQADGVLLGSQRELDPLTSWYGTGHALLQPSHPFTMASQRTVVPGQVTRFDISLLANFTKIPSRYRIQLVLKQPASTPCWRRPRKS